MLAETLRTFYDYDSWATKRIFDTANQLTPEQLEVPGTAGHGSIRQTLLHMIGTHKAWLSWWDGSLSAQEAMQRGLDPDDYPDLPSVRSARDAVAEQTQTFVNDLDDENAQRLYTTALPDGSSWTVPLWKMMLHLANHGTQHRSEVAAMLTEHNHSPGGLDILFYYFELEQRANKGSES